MDTIVSVNDAVRISETEDELVRARLMRMATRSPLISRICGEASEQALQDWDGAAEWGGAQKAFVQAFVLHERLPRTLLCMALRGLAQLDARCRDLLKPEMLADKPAQVYLGLVQEYMAHPAKSIVLKDSARFIAELLEKRDAKAA